MPQPSSATSISFIPPPRTRTAIRVAPASSAFSTSSLTTERGRSMTSPAAIWPIVSGSSTRIARTSFTDSLWRHLEQQRLLEHRRFGELAAQRRLRFERRTAVERVGDLLGARDDRRRQPRHARDFDPERPRAAARQDAMRKYRNAVARRVFDRRDVKVRDQRPTVGKRDEFVKVGREEHEGAARFALEQILAD